MYYSYIEIEYVATSFSPAITDLALKLLSPASASASNFVSRHLSPTCLQRTKFKMKLSS
jgi:hypothetical protein